MEALFNDLPKDEARRCFELLEPHSQDTFETKTTFGAYEVPISQTFVICEKDVCFLTSHQEIMAAAVPGMKTERIDGGHGAFISQPEKMAEIITRAGS